MKMTEIEPFNSFSSLMNKIKEEMLNESQIVKTETWQAIPADKPELATHELLFRIFKVPLRTERLDYYRGDIKPFLPWADDHFMERVGGEPLNPGVQWAKWRHGVSADRFRDKDTGQFSHTYMERIWPQFAGELGGEVTRTTDMPNFGVRYRLGDLNDVVELMLREPNTRAAYLPIYFPEDTGVVHRQRTPCSIGYHFIQRRGYLHMTYYLRSCDAENHLRDDLYLAVRLQLWMLDKLRERDNRWLAVKLGSLVTLIDSLHLFANDYRKWFEP
jgi:hypothetical protein